MPYKRVYYKKKNKGNGIWDESKKLEVLQSYILLGQLRLAAATCGVPEVTAKYWKATEWWRDTEQELRRASKLQLSARLTDTVSKALLVVNDRLENGDHIYNPKDKTFTRKPVSAEHANKITAQMIDRTLLIEKSVGTEKINEVGLEERLKKLMDEITKFAKKPDLAKQVNEREVIDVEVDRNQRQGSNLLPQLVAEGNESIHPEVTHAQTN